VKKVFVGIDLGGTNIKIGCFDSEIRLICKTSTPTEAEMGPKVVIERIAETIEKLLRDGGFSFKDVAAVGLGCPGPARYREGIIESATNLPKFKNTPIRQMLKDRMGKPVVFENDANAACWGEYVLGAGKGVKDMVFFTLGTGIGGGIINGGKLLTGCGDNAAELGHIIVYPDGRRCNCGQRGCAEAYASASNTAKRAVEAIEAGAESSLKKTLEEKGEITSRDVYEHLKAGDEFAKEITDGTAEALAILCVNMLHTTEPQRIVFAGGMIAAGDILLDRIKDYFNEQIWSLKKETVEICFATLGEDAGIIGAAALAKQIS
jgi:glucokinase